MASWTVIAESGATITDGFDDGEHLWVEPDAVREALGWEVKPEGLCRGDVCVPAATALQTDSAGRVDLVAIAEALRRPTLLDADEATIVVGVSAAARSEALRDQQLPDFELPDLDGNVHHRREWHGRKVLIAAFASW